MEQIEIMERISELEREIATLPPGRVSEKKVKNKIYYYHRYSQNGERIEKYVDFDKVEELSQRIERRKSLEAELKALKQSLPAPKKSRKKKEDTHEFKTYVRIGEQLVSMSSPVKKYKKRECFKELSDFVFGEQQDRVFILYGLRRTGKTTLIRQVLLSMTPEQLQKRLIAFFIRSVLKVVKLGANTTIVCALTGYPKMCTFCLLTFHSIWTPPCIEMLPFVICKRGGFPS